MKKLTLNFLPVSVLVIILACLTAGPAGANPGVVSGTIIGWSGWSNPDPVFHFDDHVTVNSDIEADWSTALVATPSGWFYGSNASTEVALAPGITDICQVADASIYTYDPHSVGIVFAGDFVLFHNTSTGYYAAFRVDNIYGPFPNYLADITWYLQEDGSGNFGPCGSDIDVDPLSLSSTQPADTTVTDTLTISNTGDVQLDWAIYEDGAGANCSAPADISWASVNLSSGMTAPGGSSSVEVNFDSTSLTPDVYTGNLCISSNDPDPGPGNGTDLVIVPLELTVPGVASGTIIAWPEPGQIFRFDDVLGVNTEIEAWWSTALAATPSGWFYGWNASTEVALAPGITAICQVADASIYTYDPWSVGPVFAGDFVLFHNTSTGYYAAFRVDNIYGPYPNYLVDITWYLQVDGSGNFGPCVSDIDVEPLSLSSTQPWNTTVTDTLTISNTGDAQLDWTVFEEDTAAYCSAPADISWASVNLSSGMTAPGGSSSVEVTFDSTGLYAGTYTGNLCITSNDPDPGPGNGTDLVVVPLELTVEAAPSIDLVKTVGLDPASCATSSTLTVVGSADVYYCYEVTNTGNITLTLHDLDDSKLGNLFAAFTYDLAPGVSVDTVTAGLEISATIAQTTVNTATWTAYNPGPLNTAEVTASATLAVEEIPEYTVFLPMIFVPSSSAQAAGQPAAALPETIPLLVGSPLGPAGAFNPNVTVTSSRLSIISSNF